MNGAPKVMAYGGFWRRLLALAIDWAVLLPLSAPIFAAMARSAGIPDFTPKQLFDPTVMQQYAGKISAVEVIVFAMMGVYFSLMESSSWQATLGKRVMRLQVTDLDGKRLSFARATARYFAKFATNFTFFFGYVMAAFTAKKQALHDMLIGTLVIKKP